MAKLSPDGRRVVILYAGGAAQVWDAQTGKPVTPVLADARTDSHAAFSPDSRRIVTSSRGPAYVWDATTGQLALPPLPHHGQITYASFSPDGRRLVTASQDRTARVWDAGTGLPITAPLEHSARVWYAAFSPDSRRVVTTSEDLSARVWDASGGRPVTPPMRHISGVRQAAFSPDGRLVGTVAEDGMARVWDALTGEPVSPPLPFAGTEIRITFSPDGRRLILAGSGWDRSGGVRVWSLPRDDRTVTDLLSLAQLLAGRPVDDTAGAAVVGLPSLEHAWQSLKARSPGDFAVSRAERVAWLRREAAAAERPTQWPAALMLLGQLVAEEPAEPELLIRRARIQADLGEWQQAAADCTRAIALGSEDVTAWRMLFEMQVLLGDAAGYRKTYREMVARFGNSKDGRGGGWIVPITGVLAPLDRNDAAWLVRWVQRWLVEDPFSPMDIWLGPALYRAGEFEAAIRRMNETLTAKARTPLGRDNNEIEFLFLAMAHHRLGHTGEARQWQEKALQAIDRAGRRGWTNGWSLNLPILRREVEALLGGR
jgi:Tol biopolymer transport system component/tetratricopeptide (TPR) repeat protein